MLSSLASSVVVLSLDKHLLNLTLSPMMTVRNGFSCVSASSVKPKLGVIHKSISSKLSDYFTRGEGVVTFSFKNDELA